MYLLRMPIHDAPAIRYFTAADGLPSARVETPQFSRLLHSAIAPGQERQAPEDSLEPGAVVIAEGCGLGYHLEFLGQLPVASQPSLVILCDGFAANLEQVAAKLGGYTGPLLTFCNDNRHALGMLLRPYMRLAQERPVRWIRHPAAARYCGDLAEKVFESLFQPARHTTMTGPVALPFGEHFLQLELVHGLQDLGIEVLKLVQDDDPEDRDTRLMQQLSAHSPRACICINLKGFDSTGALPRVCRRLGIPLHVWFVDDPRPIVTSFAEESWNGITAWCWEKAYLPWLKSCGFAESRWLPLAGDPHLFQGSLSPTACWQPCFTGSSMGTSFLDSIRRRYAHSSALETAAQQLSTDLLAGRLLPQDLPPPQLSLSPRDGSWFSALAIHSASQRKRQQWLGPLREQGLILAGDPRGWQQVFGSGITTLPDISYRNGLAGHYQQYPVQIDITSCQMPTAVNQRAFDVALSGGLAIGAPCADMHELFPPSAFRMAETPAHLCELAKWHCTHPAETRSISRLARDHILARHTYAHRLQELLGISAR